MNESYMFPCSAYRVGSRQSIRRAADWRMQLAAISHPPLARRSAETRWAWRYTTLMDGQEFAALLDSSLSNPLLRGLDVACVRLSPQDATWWSPHSHRLLEVYLYPGAFGAEKLRRMDERARRLVEESAARLVNAHDARLLPAPPVPLQAGEWLMESGYAVICFGALLFAGTSPLWCALSMGSGCACALAGRWLYSAMWRRAASVDTLPALSPA